MSMSSNRNGRKIAAACFILALGTGAVYASFGPAKQQPAEVPGSLCCIPPPPPECPTRDCPPPPSGGN